MRARVTFAILSALALTTVVAPACAVEIDGRLDPGEWDGARHITDFRLTQPLSLEPAPQPTEAWVMSTPEGLAVAFRNLQAADVPRNRTRTRRDEDAQVDRINVMVDFDGDGRSGYDFMVTLAGGIGDETITNESQFRRDWDGSWRQAVSEDDAGWTAEVLIPWYTAPMRQAANGERTIGLYLDRVIAATGERVAWPGASYMRPRFLSDFAKVTLPAYSQTLLAVTPYVVGVHDNVNGASDFDAGVDLLWKPNGQTQLTATLNPDFGQVESDDLVVNFGAEETFFSDKRPFFTENQGVFDFGLLIDNSQLIYTRRVGGGADDGSGAADIAGAVKLNGSLGATQYGVMLAEEQGDAGRSFRALRLSQSAGAHTVGLMATQVERPWLDRRADVLGVDHRWQLGDKFTLTSNVVGSRIDEAGTTLRDSGGTLVANYELNPRWRHQLLAMHFGGALELNDFGYLPRNDLNYLHYEVRQRRVGLPAASAYASHDWRYRVIGLDNDDGLRLQRQLRLSRDSQRRDGGNEFAQLQVNAASYDDQITRGHGALYRPPSASLFWERSRPRKGAWAWEVSARVAGGGLAGNDRIGYSAEFEPRYFFSDALNMFTGLYYEQTPDWLVWQHDNLVGRFDEASVSLSAGLDWSIGSRQELRVKLQAIGLDADLTEAVRVGADGRPLPADPLVDPVSDFSLSNLGFQIRYRYELAPLSYLYVVYGRGGYLLDEFSQDPASRLRESFDLRDSEQLLVKLSYRFEI